MNFMGFMRTNCGLGSDLNQLPSSYMPIHILGAKFGVHWLKNCHKNEKSAILPIFCYFWQFFTTFACLNGAFKFSAK